MDRTIEAPLTDTQLEELGARLREVRAELEATLGLTREQARPVDLDNPIGRISRVDAMQQQAMAQASRQRHEQRLEQIDAAQLRLSRGIYGDCLRCDEPIGYRRLMARPETPNCVACQAGLERRG